MTEPIRLAKQLAAQLGCSRREAEEYIAGGWVEIDGVECEDPAQRVTAKQTLRLRPNATAEPVTPVTLILHKPTGYDANLDGPQPALALITAQNRVADDQSGFRFLKRHLSGQKVLCQLGYLCSGLQVYSQDYRVERKLSKELAHVEQEFFVDVSGDIVEHGLKRLNHGLIHDGQPLPPIKVSWQNDTRLRFALKNPQPGQIEWMCQQVGLQVTAMKRQRIGRISVAGLQPGQWRYLYPDERF